MNGFDDCLRPFPVGHPRARKTDPSTSHRAAASVVRGLAHMEAEFLRALEHCPGLLKERNSSEIDQHYGWLNGTAVRHAHFLLGAGYIRDTGKERPTATGRMARVFGLTDDGLAVLKQYDAQFPP